MLMTIYYFIEDVDAIYQNVHWAAFPSNRSRSQIWIIKEDRIFIFLLENLPPPPPNTTIPGNFFPSVVYKPWLRVWRKTPKTKRQSREAASFTEKKTNVQFSLLFK